MKTEEIINQILEQAKVESREQTIEVFYKIFLLYSLFSGPDETLKAAAVMLTDLIEKLNEKELNKENSHAE